MLDPWCVLVAMLLGAHAAPAVVWPADCVHVIVKLSAGATEDDPADDIDPEPPITPQRRRLAELEDVIAEHIAASGSTSVRAIAAGLSMARQTVWARMKALEAAGRIKLTEEGWSAR